MPAVIRKAAAHECVDVRTVQLTNRNDDSCRDLRIFCALKRPAREVNAATARADGRRVIDKLAKTLRQLLRRNVPAVVDSVVEDAKGSRLENPGLSFKQHVELLLGQSGEWGPSR